MLIKAFIGFVRKIFRIDEEVVSTGNFQYLVYFDSTDNNSVIQVLKWLEFSFIPKEKVLVLFRCYRNARYISNVLSDAGVYHKMFHKFSSLSFGEVKAVFYPFNSNSNPILIKKRAFKHVFIGHGESDKRASINPMIRMYDHIFVSGDESIDRLKKNNIVNDMDIEGGRCIKVGLPYVGENKEISNHQSLYRNDFNSSINVFYAPTWEGVEPLQQYSSLEYSHGERLIEFFLARGDNIYFQPHPSTGQKQKKYLDYLKNIYSRFIDHPNFKTIISGNSSLRNNLKFKRNQRSKILDETVICDVAFCDVSSMVSICLARNMPTVALAKSKLIETNIEEYYNEHPLLKYCLDVLVDTEGLNTWRQRCWNNDFYNAWFQKYSLYMNRMVSLESNDCKEMSNKEYFEWIEEQYF